ncbi:transcription factor TGA4-like isoform X4 [Glycine soja]|uniref:transcription factor TGA4-like isoform X4 n=1 Tax=Glycine soja TaxID=3848 RepID=UPI00103AF9F9|nr:transcription factor TGA4-like isoform X4 [Glycine soja]
MSSSNQLNQSSRFLANKPRNEVNVQGYTFRIDVKNSAGNTTFVMNYGRWSEKLMKHYFELFEMKTSAANLDVFSVVSAIWCTTAERNLLWIGGFRPSQLLQVILPQVQHSCSQQQLSDIFSFVQSCQQAEDALAQGMEKLQQNLDKATAAGDKALKLTCVSQQMSFLKQANHVRQQFLYQLSRLLTICQYAEFLLAFGECLYNSQPWSSL